MNKTTEKQKDQSIATRENTAFVTVMAYEDYESKTIALRRSATDQGIPLTFYDVGDTWRGFYYHKIERMHRHLQHLRDAGKQFVFILDCRDVVFIEPLESVLKKFNALHDGRVIFNRDVPGKIWPSHTDYLAQTIDEAMGAEHSRLNAGMIAGKIETILTIQSLAMELRCELQAGYPRPGMLKRLHQDIGTSYSNDDQYLYQICLTYRPELFQIDYAKELFAVLLHYPADIRECSDDPLRRDVINDAAIIHSPWLSREPDWNDRVFQNRWKR